MVERGTMRYFLQRYGHMCHGDDAQAVRMRTFVGQLVLSRVREHVRYDDIGFDRSDVESAIEEIDGLTRHLCLERYSRIPDDLIEVRI